PYWLARTLAGISMDIGMSLLVVNLMLTALTSPAAEARRVRGRVEAPIPAPARGPAQ
ncbi:MAG: cytochrome oxidase, partial [Mesorhizobium sp.]